MKSQKNYQYCMYKYFYRLKSGCLLMEVYARKRETADEIVSYWNMDVEEELTWVPKRIGFRKKFKTNISPYELEQEQIESAQERLKCIREHSKKAENNDK